MHMHTHMRTRAHTHTHTHARAHTHTHAHNLGRYYSVPEPSGRMVMNFFRWSSGGRSEEGRDSLMAVTPACTPGGRGMVM